jgi:hypothetical protein
MIVPSASSQISRFVSMDRLTLKDIDRSKDMDRSGDRGSGAPRANLSAGRDRDPKLFPHWKKLDCRAGFSTRPFPARHHTHPQDDAWRRLRSQRIGLRTMGGSDQRIMSALRLGEAGSLLGHVRHALLRPIATARAALVSPLPDSKRFPDSVHFYTCRLETNPRCPYDVFGWAVEYQVGSPIRDSQTLFHASGGDSS